MSGWSGGRAGGLKQRAKPDGGVEWREAEGSGGSEGDQTTLDGVEAEGDLQVS